MSGKHVNNVIQRFVTNHIALNPYDVQLIKCWQLPKLRINLWILKTRMTILTSTMMNEKTNAQAFAHLDMEFKRESEWAYEKFDAMLHVLFYLCKYIERQHYNIHSFCLTQHYELETRNPILASMKKNQLKLSEKPNTFSLLHVVLFLKHTN